MSIGTTARHDEPHQTTAFNLGQEDFLNGRSPDRLFEDDFKFRRYHEGYERERGDWYQRPL